MTDDELIWRISGGSGDGIASTSQNFAKALMRSGLNVFTHRHYPSRIRGGHTYTEIRAAADPVRSRGDGYNFLLALGDSFARNPQEGAIYGNEEIKPLSENLDELREGGVIVYDEGLLDTDEIPNFDERVEENGWHVYPLDLRGLARDMGREVMRNTAGVGATCALIGMELAHVEDLMRDAMPEKILDPNLEILETAYEQVREEYDVDAHDVSVPTGEHDETQVLLSGSDAIAYGAIDEGCRFIAGYPMTPWTEVFTIMSQVLPDLGGISEQVEDEIAAAALAVGAAHAGAKAMSGSSGGGFALMSEPLGLAEMTETPVVLIEAMRAGPSTGMPTKPEQSDLEHVLYTSQGDSQRVVLAPGTVAEAYEQSRLAFRLAYEYQIPTILLYDQKLGGELTQDALGGPTRRTTPLGRREVPPLPTRRRRRRDAAVDPRPEGWAVPRDGERTRPHRTHQRVGRQPRRADRPSTREARGDPRRPRHRGHELVRRSGRRRVRHPHLRKPAGDRRGGGRPTERRRCLGEVVRRL
jgi:pyruvate ferredoxin oxidoreductase alpha subunit